MFLCNEGNNRIYFLFKSRAILTNNPTADAIKVYIEHNYYSKVKKKKYKIHKILFE